ncbi:MAG TPA: spore germination protein [Oscillospiraceae bacterium]|nr:spore germination protein [Oscillospiraceae bacterium]
MFHFSKHKEEEVVNHKVEDLNKATNDYALCSSLDENIKTLKKVFIDVDVFMTRLFQNSHDSNIKFCIAYCDGVVNSQMINDSIMKPLMLSETIETGSQIIESVMNHVVLINEAKKTSQMKEIVEAITYGDTILLADGSNEVLILNSKEIRTRAVTEPDNEKILIGPREGFNESMLQNLSAVRRRLRTNELKMKYLTLGRLTKTKVCVCYIDRIVNKNILNELYRRLGTIDIDAVLDSNYITELIKDSSMSPFRTAGYTERPDVVVGKILEGRIAIFVDGTPIVLTVPYLFIENFQSNEDYYMNFYYSSFSRLLRIIGFLLTITIPGFYIAIVAYALEMLPTTLIVNIAAARRGVPLPAAVEVFVMLLVFDVLRETGIRMPSNVGQALSIVGALVIGQAAVDAKLVAAPMIIVVAITGITSLLVPKMNAPVIYVRLFLLLLAATFGLFGFILGLCAVLIHILGLYSFGVPQLSVTDSLQFQEIKDTFIRAPWQTMLTRTKPMAQDMVRMKKGNGGNHG